MKYIKKFLVCSFGIFLFGAGLFLNIKANIGLTPWSSFTMGITNVTGLKYGNSSLIIGLVIIGIDLVLRERIGIGSILNGIFVGKIVDLLEWLDIVPESHNFFFGFLMLCVGQFMVALGSYFYMSVELGCGPRDSLMVAFGKRIKKIPIGVVRGLLEGTVAIIGWSLGAKIGIGTILSVVIIGFFIQLVFRMFHYDAKSVRHESVFDTFGVLFSKNTT